mmetsp:Transcript_25332/g.39725  ORF Transcript_25332/g.39725 Transcript_25332/m.39725 type:complete len:139 (-) Transcript_25332:102-518(-)
MILPHQYLAWREEERFIAPIMFILLLGLPMAFYEMAKGVYGAAVGFRASGLRHIGDVAQFVTLWTILLPTVVLVLIPTVKEAASCNLQEEECIATVVRLPRLNMTLLALNFLMLAWDILKYNGNRGEVAEAEEVLKEK